MKKITAILMSLALSGVAAGQDTNDDVLAQVQMAAAKEKSLNAQIMLMELGGFVQTGYLYNNGGGNPASNGFSVDRARLSLSGTTHDEKVAFLVSGQWTDNSRTFGLLDARVDLRMFDFANIRVGQFVPQFYAGYVTDPRSLTTLNYSVTALTFGQGRGQGIELSRTFGGFEVSGFYNNGFNNLNLGPSEENNFALGAAVSYNMNENLALNAGYSYNDVKNRQVNSYTLGAGYTEDLFSINADWVANDRDGDLNNWSIVTTASYQCMDDFNGWVQWEVGDYDGDLNLLTVGGNYDLGSHVVWTNSVGYSLDSLGRQFDTTNTGWVAGSDRGQFVIRSGVTVSF